MEGSERFLERLEIQPIEISKRLEMMSRQAAVELREVEAGSLTPKVVDRPVSIETPEVPRSLLEPTESFDRPRLVDVPLELDAGSLRMTIDAPEIMLEAPRRLLKDVNLAPNLREIALVRQPAAGPRDAVEASSEVVPLFELVQCGLKPLKALGRDDHLGVKRCLRLRPNTLETHQLPS